MENLELGRAQIILLVIISFLTLFTDPQIRNSSTREEYGT